MIKNKTELGNFDRGNPIMLKEKIGKDGVITSRIYQRKDVATIDNLSKKITTKIKYSVEDFFIEHKTFQKLLHGVGINRINILSSEGIENPEDLLKIAKSGDLSKSYDRNNIEDLTKVFRQNNIDVASLDAILIQNYNDDVFFKELDKIFSEHADEDTQDSLSRLKRFHNKIYDINERSLNCLEHDFEKITLGLDECSKKDPNFYVKNEFLKKKLNGVVEDIIFKQISDETTQRIIKNSCYKSKEMEKNVERAFSNHWMISKGSKQRALKSVQNYLQQNNIELPFGVARRAFGTPSPTSRSAISVSANTTGPQSPEIT
jgi:hypothetical protein